jgi:hypothetical protein
MPTPAQIMLRSAALMNDSTRAVYTDEVVLPYLNMALDELQEYYELNNVPTTNITSITLTVPANTSVIGYTTTPALPSDLIEIQSLYESEVGNNAWALMLPKSYIHDTKDQISAFITYTWGNNKINLIAANKDIDLKIDYVASLFPTDILISQINTDLPFKNIKSYLAYKTAALCSFYIGENETRSNELNGLAQLALDRSLGISTKSRQSILTRRRPFRAAYKSRGMI